MDECNKQRVEVVSTPRKSARGQGPHLERLTEHLKQLQNELSSEKATRQSTHKAQDLSDKALAAKGMSLEACQLRASLLSRTGHAKALEQNMAEVELQNSSLRRAMAAKDAQLAVVQAESEAWRRVQGPALNGISAKADSQQDLAQVLPDDKVHKQRLLDMRERLMNRTIAIEEVWAEVKLGEERVRILTAIAQASETHVKILQEELCKAHAETAAARDEICELKRTVTEQTEAVAASAGAVAKIRALEASANENLNLVTELRKRLQEADVQLASSHASSQKQLEEEQAAAAAAEREEAQEQANPHVSKSPQTGSAGSRGGKRDVRGVFRAHKPNSKSPAAHAAVRQSLYTPVKLRDMTQLGRHPSSTKGPTPGTASARGDQTKEERWTPLSERRSSSSPAPTPDTTQAPRPARLFSPSPLRIEESSQAPLPARSPLSEMQLSPVVSQPQPTPQNLDKGSPSTVTVLQLLLSSDDKDGRFLVQATYEHARPPDNAHAARIGTSKLAEPGKQEEAAAPKSTPSKAQAGDKQESTPRSATKRGLSVFQRLSPLLNRKAVAPAKHEVTPRQTPLPSAETTPVKGLARLSPARWKWGGGAAKAAASETCSPLREGAAAVTFSAPGQDSGSGSSPRKASRRKLSSVKLAPWLGK
ncbi:hypothetical protein WJX75_004885 [Coccomyxa subellipsoidea]|uniref:Uncharacterized protein n=1 Tax=Coccomyxa subellipsoidea TaxID=248742 RepID=A0ABR2Z0M8_9CHLO